MLQQEKLSLKQLSLNPGEKEEVYVVHIESPLEFYVQLSRTYLELTQLMANISEVYSGLADDVRPEDLAVGAPLCALFSGDGLWYRAVVESVTSDFEVKVRYIDYGNSDIVLLSDVRQLSRKFYELPVQAVRCRLPVIEDNELFHQRVDGKELKATFLSMENGTWEVSLLHEENEDAAVSLEITEYLDPVVIAEMKCSVYVSHIVSPDEFYVQLSSSLDELSLLSGEISRFYSQIQPTEYIVKDPRPGMSCCARFSQDGDWYRGKLKNIFSLEGAYVQFVDYGNGESVPFSEIKDPHESFMQLPQQAICCCLDVTKDRWTPEELNIFQTVALDKFFDVTFIIRDGQKWRVSLQTDGVSVVDLFVAGNTAIGQQGEKGVSSVQTKSYFEQTLTPGQVEEVFVSHVTECGEFYIQLSRTSGDLGTIGMLASEVCEQLGPTDEVLEMCFVDSLCLAKYSQDFKWYRALVTKVVSETEVEVLFVDYGNTDSQKVEAVKQMNPELVTFPVQAIKCRLEGAKETWSESDVEQFEASVIDKPLHVTFTRQEGDTWFVTIQELDMFTTKEHPKVKSFSKESFDCDKRERAYFVYADSPDCIWLQPERTGDALTELMDQIANDVSGTPMHNSQLVATLPCLGKFTDNDMWHRAQILNLQGGTNATVFYVDYGNSENLSLDRLHPISDSHLKLPAQAIRFSLADVQGVDPSKVTSYLNEALCEKVVQVEVQEQHPDGSYTIQLYFPGAEQSISEQVVCDCLGETSLLEETTFEETTPVKAPVSQERRAFRLPELDVGSKVPVSFISAFLPSEMQLLMTERVDERYQLYNSMTSLYESLDADDLNFSNPEVGDLCCVHFCPEEDKPRKWFRAEVLSISSDETATVKLVDYGTNEKIPISQLKVLKDEFLEMPIFVLESSLANIYPSSADSQWSSKCSSVLESMCNSKILIAEVTQATGSTVELILHDDSGKSINQHLIDLGYARPSDREDFSGEQLRLKWPEFHVGQRLEVYLIGVKDLKSLQLQLADSEDELRRLREELTSVYCALGEVDDVVGNPRVGLTCCAQFADDEEWYRSVITCVSDQGVEVKFVDYGNVDLAVSFKQLKEDFYDLPVQCFECTLDDVIPAAGVSETELATKLSELWGDKQLTAEVVSISGDSVVVSLFDKTESVTDVLVKLGHAVTKPRSQVDLRRLSISEDGKIVYNYPGVGEVCRVNVTVVNSPSDFWCKLRDSKPELILLSEKIDQFYQDLGENDLRLFCLQAGDVCCAKYSDDNKWYRSSVSKVDSGAQVHVNSVDYPKKETLTLDRIKKLEAEFAKLPVQYFNCSLADIEPPHRYYGEDWSTEAVKQFKEFCNATDVKVTVERTEGSVVFAQLLDSTGLSIADKLMSEGLAVESKAPLTVTPTKESWTPVVSSMADQVDGAIEQSSEEEIFEEAESGIERVDLTTKEDSGVKDEEDEEFHDSVEEVTGLETYAEEEKVGPACPCGEESGTELPSVVQEEKETQLVKEKEYQKDDKKGEADSWRLAKKDAEDVPEGKTGLEVEAQYEYGDMIGEGSTMKDCLKEEKEGMEVQECGGRNLGEDQDSKENQGIASATEQEGESKETRRVECAQTSLEEADQCASADVTQEEDGLEKESHTVDSSEEKERQEEGTMCVSISEHNHESLETSQVQSSDRGDKRELEDIPANCVLLVEEKAKDTEEEANNVDRTREEQGELSEATADKSSEEDAVEKEGHTVDSSETARERQEFVNAAITEQNPVGNETIFEILDTDGADIVEGASATGVNTGGKDEMVKEETSDVGSLETAREELHMKGSSVSDLGIDKTTVKGEEQDFQFTEACGSVTEAFSEEDLTGMCSLVFFSSNSWFIQICIILDSVCVNNIDKPFDMKES